MEDTWIIAVHRQDDALLNAERRRIAAWAPGNRWHYLEYAESVELLSQLADLQPELLREIEIVGHGNPAECDDVSIGNTRAFGESLRRLQGFSNRTRLYVSGCNTGLYFAGDCVAKALAESCQAIVCGARGYLTGTHAEQSARCVSSFTFGGILYEAFTDAADADGEDVWRCFGPPLRIVGGEEDMDIKISTTGFRPVNLAGEKVAQLRNAVEQAIQRPSAESAPYRVAPDITFAIRLHDGEHIFEMLAGGTVLRDPVSKRVWQLPGGRILLESLWPYRNGSLPAA